MYPGAARGPPGTDGGAGGAGREGVGTDCVAAITMGRCFVSTFVGDWGLLDKRPPLSLRMLVLRPRDAKKPVPELFDPGNGICRDLAGDSSSVEVRAGARCNWTCASEGYGSMAGGAVVGGGSLGRVDRSVAVYASARIGNVISDAIDPCEMCRGDLAIPPNSAGRGCMTCCAVRWDWERGCEASNQVSGPA